MEPRPASPHPTTGEAVSFPKQNGTLDGAPEWGVYNASGIHQLVAWIKAGSVKSEGALASVLNR